MSDHVITPDIAAQQIRFGLSRLRSRNAHHQFEDACRYFATARISRNILPATGPVAAGGDQGRDFETFRSYLNEQLPGYFMAIEHNMPVVFACTLQAVNMDSKIKKDIAAVADGSPTEAMFVFCEADIPVSRRHQLIAWAREEYDITLEIIDGSGLAEQLTQDDVFWIAERYLAVPANFRPVQTSALQAVDQELAVLLSRPPSIALPDWPEDWSEAQYNTYVPHVDTRFLNLDRILVRTPDIKNGVEICDLLGPNDEFIHVRRVNSGASFAHLYNQGIVSARLFLRSQEIRRALAEKVKLLGAGRTVARDSWPRKIVLAFPHRGRSALTLQDIPVFYRENLIDHMKPRNPNGFVVDILGIRQISQRD